VHTFIRIPAGAALAAAVMGDQGGALQVAMGLVGGTLAAGTHLAKAGARAAINTSPEPVSNVATSLGEDVLFAGGMWALVHQPLLFLAGLAVFFILALLLIVALWKFIKRVFRRPPRPLAAPDKKQCNRRRPDVQQDPDRQPRRDRLPRHQDRAPPRHQDRGRVFRRRRRRAPRAPGRRGRAYRPGGGRESYLVIERIIAAASRPAPRRSTRATASCPRTRISARPARRRASSSSARRCRRSARWAPSPRPRS
jgi:hypothetical protein